jgi:hypothetical protein
MKQRSAPKPQHRMHTKILLKIFTGADFEETSRAHFSSVRKNAERLATGVVQAAITNICFCIGTTT